MKQKKRSAQINGIQCKYMCILRNFDISRIKCMIIEQRYYICIHYNSFQITRFNLRSEITQSCKYSRTDVGCASLLCDVEDNMI